MNASLGYTHSAPPLRSFLWARAWGALTLVAVALFYAVAPLSWCIAFLVALVGAYVLIRRPTWGLFALALAIPFGSTRAIALAGMRLGLAEFILGSVTFFWMIGLLARGNLSLGRSPLLLGLGAYLATLTMGLGRAQTLAPAIKELIKWSEVLLVYLIASTALSRREQLVLAVTLLVAGTLEGLLGIYQFTAGVGPEGFQLLGKYMRASGTFGQPNPYGGYLGLTLPLAYALVFWTMGQAFRRGKTTLLSFGLLSFSIVAIAIMAAGLIMSWSRGALLGLAGGIVFFVAGTRRGRWALLILGLIITGLMLAPTIIDKLPPMFLQRFEDAFRYIGADLRLVEIDDLNFAIIERLAHWQAAWQMFSEKPWLGIGTGQYAIVYPRYALPRWQDPLGHAHNYYLNVLAEGGLIGLAGYLTFIGTAFVSLIQRARRSQGWAHWLALAAMGTMGHLLTHSLVDNLYVHNMYVLIAMILGLAIPCRSPICRAHTPSSEKV